MGLLLVVHLGVVLALFLTLPYGKFVHGSIAPPRSSRLRERVLMNQVVTDDAPGDRGVPG